MFYLNFRQLAFDLLYCIEFVILLSFGFTSQVKEFNWSDEHNISSTLAALILGISVSALVLKLIYYTVCHVWRSVILSSKKLIKQEFIHPDEDQPDQVDNIHMQEVADAAIQKGFFKYVFISRNTWILGSLKHIEITLLLVPKKIIEAIKGRREDLDHSFTDAIKHSPLELLKTRTMSKLLMSLFCFPLILLVILINVVLIILLVVGLVLCIPVAIVILLYNLCTKRGFKIIDPFETSHDQTDSSKVIHGESESLDSSIYHIKGLFSF